MSRFTLKIPIPLVLVLAGLLLTACQSTPEPQLTPEAQQNLGAVRSLTNPPSPTEPLTPAITAGALSPQPSRVATPTPAPIPTKESSPAPDDGSGGAYEIRSIETVSIGGPPRMVEITDADAVLVFQSSIPLACSVIYGETTDYGQVSLDQDMEGGAHTDHRPLLLNLEPDTEYHYRVQGTAADGTLYVGEDGTFRTLPAEDQAGLNLASLDAGARILAVSSNFGGAANDGPWGANSAIDGQRATAWSSNGDGNDAFLEIELAQASRVQAIEAWTRSMSDGTAQVFAFTVSTDGGDVLGPFELPSATEAYRFELEDVVARTLRLDVIESSGGNTGLVEFAVYGIPAEE